MAVVTPRRIQLPLKQVVCHALNLAHDHRSDLCKLALPFILFFTWFVAVAAPDIVYHPAKILGMEYHTQAFSVQGGLGLFALFYIYLLAAGR